MQHFSYQSLLETSRRVNWRIEDIVGEGRRLDFSKPFLPETFARTTPLTFLSPAEQLTLNHIRARGYIGLFEVVEQFVLPFVAEQAEAPLEDDPYRAAALQHFAAEEAKHTEVFRRVLREFDEAFGSECGLIGPAADIAHAILSHSPLAVAIATLGLEYMSQGHYVESIKDDRGLDPQFKSLLRHHWIEEAQHAKLDERMLRALAAGLSPEAIDAAVDEYFEIGGFFDDGFRQQATLDLEALERAVGRRLADDERTRFVEVQHQALRWTFLGTAMSNEGFLAALGDLSPAARARVEAAVPMFR